jgi:TonB family protein
LLALGGFLLARSLGGSDPAATRSRVIEVALTGGGVELPSVSGTDVAGSPVKVTPDEPPQVLGGGGDRVPRPDMKRAGRGGTDESAEAALNLADSNDGLTLDRDPINRFDRSQLQRLRTDSERATRDDRRATPNPMQLSFLSSGEGERAYRRPPAKWDPSAGAERATQASVVGGTLGAGEAPPGVDGALSAAGGALVGDEERPASGVSDGRPGDDQRRSARVVTARPWVPAARAAVPAPVRDRPNDTLDSAQEVASRVASLIHASSAGGRLGSGAGGTRGPETPSSGAHSGAGSQSLANGYGPGSRRDDAPDPRLMGYARSILKRVHWDDAFPEWAISEGRGGVAIISITVRSDGRLSKVRVVRASGVGEFDRNLVAAIERAAPFDPVPRALGAELPVQLRFDALNPAVGREGPGPGRRY